MINPGTAPLDDTREDLAAANVEVLLAAARDRGAALGEPVRNPAADRDGRYGWDVPAADGMVVRLLMPGVLMPGVELIRLQADMSSRSPCLLLRGCGRRGAGRRSRGAPGAARPQRRGRGLRWSGGADEERTVRLAAPRSVRAIVRIRERGAAAGGVPADQLGIYLQASHLSAS
ncbi:hypothetical protein [Krasilnikovia sp. M28-CT-15]|uniref:hypothetical protein n=1 Tax=Krasilnikovia sp. M28-CT-15 TaxID=3373540 RepID=UPI003877174F